MLGDQAEGWVLRIIWEGVIKFLIFAEGLFGCKERVPQFMKKEYA